MDRVQIYNTPAGPRYSIRMDDRTECGFQTATEAIMYFLSCGMFDSREGYYD